MTPKMGGYRRTYGVYGTTPDSARQPVAPGTFASLRISSPNKDTYTYYFDSVQDKGTWNEVRVILRSHPSVKMAVLRLNIRNSGDLCLTDVKATSNKDDWWIFNIVDADFPRTSDIRIDLTLTELISSSDEDKDKIWVEVGTVECHFN